MTYRISEVNSWNGWDPLKQVILGNVYSPDWFRDIKDTKLKNLIQTLMRETQEDLDGIQKTMENLGVDVVRVPENTTLKGTDLVKDAGIDSWGKYLQFIHDEKLEDLKQYWNNGLPKPMITPRDTFIVLGNQFVQTHVAAGTKALVDNHLLDPSIVIEEMTHKNRENIWKEKGFPVPGPIRLSKDARQEQHPNWEPGWDDGEPADYKFFEDSYYKQYCYDTWGFWAPMVTRVGDTLIVDIEEQENLAKYVAQRFPEFKQARVAIGGHNDGTFCPPKPGLIVSADPDIDFSETFPGWDVFTIPDLESIDPEFRKWHDFKDKVDGRWWQPGAEASDNYVQFVDNWLNKWVGYAEETVFEVNMLSIDPETILCLNKQDEVHDALKAKGIDPVYTRFRHRKFWDGGLHCLTVDTVREGTKQNYFT